MISTYNTRIIFCLQSPGLMKIKQTPGQQCNSMRLCWSLSVWIEWSMTYRWFYHLTLIGSVRSQILISEKVREASPWNAWFQSLSTNEEGMFWIYKTFVVTVQLTGLTHDTAYSHFIIIHFLLVNVELVMLSVRFLTSLSGYRL